MKEKILLCGTGARLGHMTVETARALRSCGRILCVNLPAELFREVARSFPRAEALPMKETSPDAALCGDVRRRPKTGPALGVLFLGHPLIYSAAPALIALCRRQKRAYRVLPGVSLSDAVLAASEPAISVRGLDSFGSGLAVLGAHQLLRDRTRLDPRSAAVILNLHRLWSEFPREPDVWRRMTDHLERHYPRNHPAVLVSCGRDGAPDRRRALTLRSLRDVRVPIDSATTLFLPMRRA